MSTIFIAVNGKSTSRQNKRARLRSDAGSSDFPLKDELPVCFYEFLKNEDPEVFQVTAAEKEVEITTVDILDREDVFVTEAVLNNVVLKEKIDPDTSFQTSPAKENIGKSNVQVQCNSSASSDLSTVSVHSKLTEDTSRTVHFPDGDVISDVTTDTIDTICFPFLADGSTVPISIEGFEFRCLVDTGAAITAVSANVWNNFLRHVCPSLGDSGLENITSDILNTLGKTVMQFVIQSEIFPFEAYVIGNLTYDVILGRDFLQKFGSKIDFEKGMIEFVSEVDPLPFCNMEGTVSDDYVVSGNTDLDCSVHADFSVVIPPQSEVVVSARLNAIPQQSNAIGVVAPRSTLPEKYSVFGASELVRVSEDGTIPMRIINPSSQPVKIHRRTKLGDFEEVDSSIATFESNSIGCANTPPSPTVDNFHRDYSDLPNLSDSGLSEGDEVKFKNLFQRYRDVFPFSDDQLGRTSLVQHTIDTGDAMPIKQRPYRTTPGNKQEIDRQVDDMLQRGIIQESVSPWSSPVVLVKKKNGEMRFCVDFRAINKVTKKDSFPMPLVADTLDALSGTQYFSTLDLKSGYWQIELHPSAREKTAFVTHNGLYEFLVMPFGLTNSGASFQRLMGHILRSLEYRFALIYIDDIIIFSKSVEEHLVHLEEVFRRLREANVKLNPKKCSFVKQKVEYLGHVVTPEGVMPGLSTNRVETQASKRDQDSKAFIEKHSGSSSPSSPSSIK